MQQRPFFITMLLILWIIVIYGVSCAETPQEFKVKASYLLNMPRFADWPASTSGNQSFKICTIGETPLFDLLVSMKDLRIKNHPVLVLSINEIAQANECQVLFIAASERYRLQRLLPEAHKLKIMTISDMRDFSKLGGIIALVSVNNRITYDLNLVTARSAGITFNSQILKLANDVIN